jgi:hypothetical protein
MQPAAEPARRAKQAFLLFMIELRDRRHAVVLRSQDGFAEL